MAALLVGMSVMAIIMSVAMPVWNTAARRERETELIFRGEQYARAVALFQRKNAGAFPPSLDVLLNGRYLRAKYKDPMTEDGEFQLVPVGAIQAGPPAGGRAGQVIPPPQPGRGAQTAQLQGGRAGVGAQGGGIMGVMSKSTAEGLRLYNGRSHYNEWLFVATQATTQAGSPTGAQNPGQPGRGGRGDQGTQPGRGTPPGIGQPPGARGQPPPGRGGFPQPFGLPPFGQPQAPGRGRP
jgi:type II secretory pathway pseudopilin PulG